MIEALNEAVIAARRALPRHLRRHAADGGARARIRDDARPRLDRRRRRRDRSRADPALKIPHMGWNTLVAHGEHPLLAGIPTGPDGLHAYFVHSFHLVPRDADDVVAEADYAGPITAIVGARQSCRHAVPSREEPGARACADRQFPEVAAVILYPAIDLKDGRCVRLVQGDMAQATVFNDDPAAQARGLRGDGLRPAPCRRSRRRLRRQAGERRGGRGASSPRCAMPVQLGGGIRDMATVEGWLGKGVARVIIGTAAVRDPAFVGGGRERFPGQVAVGLDARDGLVAVEGWAETSTVTAVEIARRFEDAGVAAIIYTDIARDGMLKGIDWDGTLDLARRRVDPGRRLGRARLDRRYRAPAGARCRDPRRRHRRPRAL